jgi:uncharacterized membrane protein YcaP (DUF421 family)
MGKRQIGELDVGDLVSTLLISELAAIPIDDPDIPLLNAIIPSLIIVAAEILISSLKNKSEKIKEIVEGTPTYIIYKGRILQSVLDENRISINEVLAEMRTQGIGDISEIYYGIVEQNGTLSLLKRGGEMLAHTVIVDGTVMKDGLKRLGRGDEWLLKKLRERGVIPSEVFLMTVTDAGEINLVKKEKNK